MISNTLPQSLIDNPILSQWIAFEEHGPRPGRLAARSRSARASSPRSRRSPPRNSTCGRSRSISSPARPTSARPRASPRAAIRSRSAAPRSGWSAPRCARCSSIASPRRCGCPVGELSIEDGKFLRAGKDTGRDYWSMAGEIALERRASGTAPVKRPSTYKIVGKHLPRLDLPAKVAGAGFIHDIAPDERRCTPACCGSRGAARILPRSTRARCARPPGRRSRSCARASSSPSPPTSELAVMRAAEAARTLAQWEGGTPPPADVGTPAWLKAQPSRDKTTETGQARPRAGRAAWSRPPTRVRSSPMARSARPARSPNSRTARSRSGRTRRARRCCANGSPARSGLPAAQVNVFHRQGAGAYGHNTADDAAFDASFIAMRHPGRTVRVQWSREDEFAAAPISTAMAITLRAVLDADNKPADWTIEIWSPPHAQRPGMNGNSNLLGAAALPNAPPLNPLSDVPDERGGGATRNAVAIYDLPRHRLIHHLLPRGADAHLVAARARRLGQRVRHRVLHRRTGRDRRRGPGELPAVAALRSRARAAWSRPRREMSGWFEQHRSARRPRPRLRLRPLQEHRLVRRRGGRGRGRRRRSA